MKVIGNLHILGQKSIIKMNTNPANNLEYSGWISDEFVGENVTIGQGLYFDHTEQRWKLAKADVEATMPCRAIALEDILNGQSGKLLRYGTLRIDGKQFTNPYIYISDSVPGEITDIKPTTIGSIIQKIGCPVKNNTGWYDFNSTTTVINE